MAHPGIGLVLTRQDGAVHAESSKGKARIQSEQVTVIAGENPLEPYGTESYQLRAIESLVAQGIAATAFCSARSTDTRSSRSTIRLARTARRGEIRSTLFSLLRQVWSRPMNGLKMRATYTE